MRLPLPLVGLLVCAGTASAGFIDGVITCVDVSSSCASGTSQVGSTSTGSDSLSGTFGPAGDQFTINGTATSSYGYLHMYNSTSLNIAGTPGTFHAEITGNFTDTLTISDPSLTGTTGYLVVGYTLDATISSLGIDQGSLWVGANVNGQSDTAPYASSVNGSFTFPVVTFTYGQPFSFLLAMDAATATGVYSLPLIPPLNVPTLNFNTVGACQRL